MKREWVRINDWVGYLHDDGLIRFEAGDGVSEKWHCSRCGGEEDRGRGTRIEFQVSKEMFKGMALQGKAKLGWWDYELCDDCATGFLLWWQRPAIIKANEGKE